MTSRFVKGAQVALLTLVALVAQAQPVARTWVGPSPANPSGNWSVASNWSGGVKPAPGTYVFFPEYPASYTVTLDEDAIVGDFEVGDVNAFTTQTLVIPVGRRLTQTDTTPTSGSSVLQSGILRIQGSLVVPAGGRLGIFRGIANLTGSLVANGEIEVDPAGTLTLTSGSVSGQSAASKVTIRSGGLLIIDAGTGVALDRISIINKGRIDWLNGKITTSNSAGIINEAGATFAMNSNGDWVNSGSAGVFSNAGTVTQTMLKTSAIGIPFNQTAGGVAITAGGTIDFNGGGNSTGGTFNTGANGAIGFGGNHTVGPGVTVTGNGNIGFLSGSAAIQASFTARTTTVFAGATAIFNRAGAAVGDMRVRGTLRTLESLTATSFDQISGATILEAGTLTSPAAAISGGVLQGNGVFATNLTNGGTIRPGLSPGKLTINGNYTQQPSGSIEIEIAGTAPATQYDQFVITGNAVLAGTLKIDVVGSFSPLPASQFSIITYKSHIGTFTNITGLVLGSGKRFIETYSPTVFVLDTYLITNVSVVKTGPASAAPGQFVTYEIRVSSTVQVTGINVNDPVPSNLTGVTWTCSASSAGKCGATSGSGAIAITVDIPVGGMVVFTLRGQVAGNASGSIQNTASVTLPAGLIDLNPDNNSSTSVATIGSGCPSDYKPLLAAVAESQSGLPFNLTVVNPLSSINYEFQLGARPDFADAETMFSSTPTVQFTRTVTVDRRKFYARVRGAGCGGQAFSMTVEIVVFATPTTTLADPNLKAQFGTTQPIPFNLFIPGSISGKTALDTTVSLSTDKSYVTVTPPSINVPAAGATVNGVVDPAELPVGTSTATVDVANATTGANIATVPVSVTLSTPVVASGRSTLIPGSLIIPVVAHVKRSLIEWVSDLRLANMLEAPVRYQLTFTPSDHNGLETGKQTVVRIDSGQTIAFDNVAEQEFGVGSTGELGAGVLEIRPLDLPGNIGTAPALFVSSRTHHQSGGGSVGQSVPVLPATAAIGKSLSTNRSVIVLQPIAQNSSFRTNLGLLEVSGQPVSVLIRLLDPLGHQLDAFSLDLRPAEHQQLNSYPLRRDIALDEGRIEVEVTSLTGSVMAYASVVEATSEDALFVPGNVSSGNESAWIVPAVTRTSDTRTDLRVLNSGGAGVSATFTFNRANAPAPSSTATLTIAPGETRVLDDIMLFVFGETTATGTLRVTTPGPAPLQISGRTVTSNPAATTSSFLEARLPVEAVGFANRPLQILQVEESERFESDLGIVEVTGSAALIRVSGAGPDSKSVLDLPITLQGNETRELPSILNLLNLGRVYNGRVAVQVMQGTGRVIAYAIVRDLKTGDVTVIRAQ